MAVYVDPIFEHGGSATFKWTESCHMIADSLEELNAMARKLNMRREWLQTPNKLPHYDLTVNKRRQAVRLGAITLKSRRAMVRKMREIKGTL